MKVAHAPRLGSSSWRKGQLISLSNTSRICILAVLILSCFRLAHAHLLWADEDYHMAAAVQMLHGKVPYRDFWYDKPPLAALYYLLIGAHAGFALRLLDAAYICICSFVLYRLGSRWRDEAAGLAAASLFAFYTTFYLPSAVIPFAADAVMLLPHLAAMYFAYTTRPKLAGLCCALAFWANPKGLFVAAACAIWLWPRVRAFALVFAGAIAVGAAVLFFTGAWPGYVEQVWRWGFEYAAGSPVHNVLVNGAVRSANWAGFHVALVLGAAYGLATTTRNTQWKLGAWIALSFAAVALGSRFAPHYFLQLLPALALAAAFGINTAIQTHRKLAIGLLGVLLAIPLVRFGPRYLMLASDLARNQEPRWIDVAMDEDSQIAAAYINAHKHPADTLLVWGYRPDVYVYTRLASDGLFWDSQPLTGVAADRHLSAITAIYGGPAQENRKSLLSTHPEWLVDGLGLLNPKLSPENYRELRNWLSRYELVDRTPLSRVYHLSRGERRREH